MEYEKIEGDEIEVEEKIEVKIVRRSGDATLVAWIDDGKYRRVTIPRYQIEFDASYKTGITDKQTLELGIPYGLPWEEIIGEIRITPGMIANTLRQHGIWTSKDLNKNTDAVVGALQAAYGLDLATLLRGARRYKEN